MSKEIERNKHPDKAEMETRINIVASAIVDGCGRNDIQLLKTVKAWNVSSRTIDNYIRAARKSIVTEAKKEMGSIVSTTLRRFERIYFKALTTGNLKEANNALVNICKLTGNMSNTVNIQQNNLIQNNNGINGNEISNSQELIELTEALAKRLAGGEIESDIVNALSD